MAVWEWFLADFVARMGVWELPNYGKLAVPRGAYTAPRALAGSSGMAWGPYAFLWFFYDGRLSLNLSPGS